ncbi:hypothetical protein NADFUDRAFT_29026 [Nadsonia fulvescens var. elongata DSM 6958]|uniref:Uncharacterized protein n=1 Tax=Nadsonia fulvescens var. elongata DSM 6958 TaxID=857566 RepID=A0A1E3PCY1_9ASCO|nr:hypothetical protein NADFUDRAFT_29026 [Nadsonia fulvescens var. elongata DSM 6958]
MLLEAPKISDLNNDILCREPQIALLNAYLSQDINEIPPALVIHGCASTGKSFVLKSMLGISNMNYSWISCDQCVTTRILLQRTLRSIVRDSQVEMNSGRKVYSAREVINAKEFDPSEHNCENFTLFYANLEKYMALAGYNETHVLVLDKIDKLGENPSDLYTCFSRLSQISQIKNLVVIFVLSTLEPRSLLTNPIPHITFTKYSKSDVLQILGNDQLRSLPRNVLNENSAEADLEDEWFWNQYVKMLVDSLISYVGTDLRMLQDIALRIWPIFIKPIVDGKYEVKEFIKLYRENQYLFTSELSVVDSLINRTPVSTTHGSSDSLTTSRYDLPLHSKYLLCAAYLASYNPPKTDVRFFSKAKDARSKRRDGGRRKPLKINPRLLAAPAFDLERMLAIFQAIIPENDGRGDSDDEFVTNIDINVQIATLATLKLVVRTSNADPLDSRTRWKVNVSWALIRRIANDIKFHIEYYLLE